MRDAYVQNGRPQPSSVAEALLAASVWCGDVSIQLRDQIPALDIKRFPLVDDLLLLLRTPTRPSLTLVPASLFLQVIWFLSEQFGIATDPLLVT